MIVAGVGCRRGTSADEIERVVRLALGLFELPAERLEAIATESEKATEPGLSRRRRGGCRSSWWPARWPISIAWPARS